MISTFYLMWIACLSCIIGSFLNVVIYRYPLIDKQNFNFLRPRSHCTQCKVAIPIYLNIPIISFIFLRGKCLNCNTQISLLYPSVEIITMLCTTLIFYHYGLHEKSLAIGLLIWNMIALSFIDSKNFLLPDCMTLPFLWLGLFFNSFHLITTPSQAITGAIFGYLSLWSAAFIFKHFKKQDGMGHGDFKMLAMLGAWLGFSAILKIICIATSSALLISLLLIFSNRMHKDQPIPFGPFLALAGWIQIMGFI